jgi:hypothetical protein
MSNPVFNPISVAEIIAFGNPFVDNNAFTHDNTETSEVRATLSKALTCVGSEVAVSGKMSEDSKLLLDYLKSLKAYKTLDRDMLSTLNHHCGVVIDAFSEATFSNTSAYDLQLNHKTFAFADGTVYTTPVSLVFGNIYRKAADLINGLAEMTDYNVRARLEHLTAQAGVSVEVASEAMDALMGFREDLQQSNVNGIAFTVVKATSRYNSQFGSTKDGEIVVAVVLREWEIEIPEDQPIEKVLLGNALDFAEDAVTKAFSDSRENLQKRYQELNRIMQLAKLQKQSQPS